MQITSTFVLIAILALKSTSVVAAPIDTVALQARSLQIADLALDLEARGFDNDAFLDAREYEDLEARDPTTISTTGTQSLSDNTKAPLTPGSNAPPTPITPLTPLSAASTSEFPSHHHRDHLNNLDNFEVGHGGLGHRRHSFDEAFPSHRNHRLSESEGFTGYRNHRLSESDPNFLPHHSLRRAASLSATDRASLSTAHQMTKAERKAEKRREHDLAKQQKKLRREQEHKAKKLEREERKAKKLEERLEREKAKIGALKGTKQPLHGSLKTATEHTVGAKAVQPNTAQTPSSQIVTRPTAHGTNLLATPGDIQRHHSLASADLPVNVDAKSTTQHPNALHVDSQTGPITNHPSRAAVAGVAGSSSRVASRN